MEDLRLESFPFDSKAAGYDDYGYPVYDRAVGASMLRQTLAQFFTNGVFGTPAETFLITKGNGLSVNVAEGVAIINGAISSVPDGGVSVKLTDETTTVGSYAYGIYLRYDENSDKRSCYIVVRKGEAGPSPTPPDPDRSTPGIWELRLGYVVVPTGSTDLSGATVTNEKGLAVCPYAAPFEDIDLSEILNEVKVAGTEAYNDFIAYLEKNIEFIQSAIDGTTAGNLQNQIDQLRAQVEGFDLSDSVDNETIEFAESTLGGEKKLSVKDGGITQEKIAEGLQLVSTGGEEGQLLERNGTSTKWGQFKKRLLWEGKVYNSSITIQGLMNYELFLIEGLCVYGNYASDEDRLKPLLIAIRRDTDLVGGGGAVVVPNDNDSSYAYYDEPMSFAALITSDTEIKPAGKAGNRVIDYFLADKSSYYVHRIWGIA